jgi:predicted O-methyltransferase YrrM
MPSDVGVWRHDTCRGGIQGLLRHPLFAWLGLRPVLGQHTAAEHAALKRWAAGRASLVEIGVAEGASAVALREAMSSEGVLSLVDPFHLSRNPRINATKRAAQRALASCQNGEVVWIEKFSSEAVKTWTRPLDFLFLDGDHSESAVREDWNNWHRFVIPGGVVALHDARVFPGGWPQRDSGPVKVVDAFFRGRTRSAWTIVDEVDSMVVAQRSE